MISSPFLLFALCAAAASVAMAALSLLRLRIRDAGHLDLGWLLAACSYQREVSAFPPRPPRHAS